MTEKVQQISRRDFISRGVGIVTGLALSSKSFGSLGLGGEKKERTLEEELSLQTEILFNSDRIGGKSNIFLMDATGENQRNLTENNCANYGGVWSSDGKRVVYGLRDINKVYMVGLVNFDGGGQKVFSNLPGENRFNPQFYPDGRNIGYLSGIDGVGDICRMDLEGNFLANLTQGIEGSKKAYAIDPSGERMAVIVEKKEEKDKNRVVPSDIIVMDAMDGGNRRTLLKKSAHFSPLFWSSDGNELYYRSFDRGRSDVFKIGQDNREGVLLSEGAGNCMHFTLSPDGERVYYTLNNGGRPEIWEARSDGEAEKRKLTGDEFFGIARSVSPDGKYLAGSVRGREPGINQVFVMKIDEPEKRKVLTNLGSNSSPLWRPA